MVSDIRLGDSFRVLERVYRINIEIKRDNKFLGYIGIMEYEASKPDLHGSIYRHNPDIVLFSTSCTNPDDNRFTVYDHITAVGKPIIVADVLIKPCKIFLDERSPNAYVDVLRNREDIGTVLDKSIKDLISNK